MMGVLMVILPPHCTHILQGKGSNHFSVFKAAFRVERAEIEAMKQLAAAWFIKVFENGVATSFGQREFLYAIREAWKGAWTKQAVKKGFTMQGFVSFNRAQLWKNALETKASYMYRRNIVFSSLPRSFSVLRIRVQSVLAQTL